MSRSGSQRPVEHQEITPQVTAGVADKTPDAEAARLRRANIAKIEKECATRTGNRCDVVTLFAGARYDLYEYKKYTDIRLVFAPEFAMAFFGGDPENFTYPRHDLDITFFRAYEKDRPARPLDYFRFSHEGARDGELIFTSGNPGTTGRLMTVAQLEFLRDTDYPLRLRPAEGAGRRPAGLVRPGRREASPGGGGDLRRAE